MPGSRGVATWLTADPGSVSDVTEWLTSVARSGVEVDYDMVTSADDIRAAT